MNKRRLSCLAALLMLLACWGCGSDTATDASTLTLSGGLSGNDIAQNAAQSVNVALREMDNFFFTDTMLLNQLVTHDKSVDIYYVEGSMVSTDIIFRKDFAAPIVHPELAEDIAGMYRPLREAVTKEQTIMGMPIYVAAQEYCLAYDLTVYDMCLEEGYALPTSWLQLLEQIAQWDETLWQRQITPVGMDARKLVQITLDYIMAQQQAKGGEIGFSAEDNVALIDVAYRAGQAMSAHQMDRKEHILFRRQGLTVGHSEMEGLHTYAMPLRDEDTPIIPLRICVAFINPYSPKQDLAQAYLAAYYDQMDPMLRMALSPQANQTMESPQALEQMKQLQETIQWLESALVEAESAPDKKELETQLAECRRQLELAEKNRYQVDEASLAAYGETMQYGVVLTEQLWQDQSVSQLIEQLVQGKMTPPDFCRELERVVQMKEAERG